LIFISAIYGDGEMNALIPDTLWEIGGLAATIYSIGQARQLHDEQLKQSKMHHEIEMDLAIKQHKKNLVETKRVYLLELFTNLEQHFQQLNADLISSGKEAERDMFDQRNQNFQTIILASSVMFTALSTVIIDGALPTQTSEALIVAFSLTSALSFAFLFLSMVICMELVMRASSFMYRRARNHTDQLRQAIKDTKAMMEELRNGTRNRQPGAQSPRHNQEQERKQSQRETSANESELSPTEPSDNLKPEKQGLSQRHLSGSSSFSAASPRVPARKHRVISHLDEDGLEREWKNHETELQRFLAERERINDATALVGVDEKNLRDHPNSQERTVNRKSFQEFWNESCKFWAELSILFFYGGTINLLLAIMVFMWAQFLHLYQSLIGAIIAISLISFSLVLGIAGVIGLRLMKATERHYHPAEANRRRIGHNNMRSLSSSSSQSVSTIEPDSKRAFRQGYFSAQNSVESCRGTMPSVSRNASISFLPEFGRDTCEEEEEEMHEEEDSTSRKSQVKTQDRMVPNNSRYDETPKTFGEPKIDIEGIAMISPATMNNSHRIQGAVPFTSNSSMSGDRIPSLFRRPSPRNLFPASIDQNYQASPAATPQSINTPSSIGGGLPPRPHNNDRGPQTPLPPHTPSISEPSVPSNGGYPPLPHSAPGSAYRIQGTPQTNISASVDRRAYLGRQSSAPSSLPSRQPFHTS
jgi:hypothetical protein